MLKLNNISELSRMGGTFFLVVRPSSLAETELRKNERCVD